jgi:RNA polymerase sigma-70 factor (ECF subfamily)
LTPTDAELVGAARAGSSSAFQAIVARHQQGVRSFLRRAAGNVADADDLAQETFLAAWSSLWRYGGRASLRAWLCGIAWKKYQTFVRSRSRERRREEAAADTCEGFETRPGDRLDAARALALLPADQRAAVALCLAADFSHSEAAEVLDLPLGTIKSHVQRGRAKLLDALGGSDDRR